MGGHEPRQALLANCASSPPCWGREIAEIERGTTIPGASPAWTTLFAGNPIGKLLNEHRLLRPALLCVLDAFR